MGYPLPLHGYFKDGTRVLKSFLKRALMEFQKRYEYFIDGCTKGVDARVVITRGCISRNFSMRVDMQFHGCL